MHDIWENTTNFELFVMPLTNLEKLVALFFASLNASRFQKYRIFCIIRFKGSF